MYHVTIKLVFFIKYKKIEYYIKILSSKLQTYLIVLIIPDKNCCNAINMRLITLLDIFINNLKKQNKIIYLYF